MELLLIMYNILFAAISQTGSGKGSRTVVAMLEEQVVKLAAVRTCDLNNILI